MIHELKIQKQYFDDIIRGKKTFEIRKADRDYRVGDILELHYLKDNGEISPGYIKCEVLSVYSLGDIMQNIGSLVFQVYDLTYKIMGIRLRSIVNDTMAKQIQAKRMVMNTIEILNGLKP